LKEKKKMQSSENRLRFGHVGSNDDVDWTNNDDGGKLGRMASERYEKFCPERFPQVRNNKRRKKIKRGTYPRSLEKWPLKRISC